jgi:basic amino acid/polyamine antiporter, APA family
MADTEQSAAPPARPTFFARNATGLVREIRIRDATILNALPGGPGVVLAVSIFWLLSAFPGANLYIAMLIAAVGAFLVIGAFGLLSQVMPRTGGDYILVSRSLHPALGFVSSVLVAASALLAVAFWGVVSASLLVSPLFTYLGITTGSATLTRWGIDLTKTPETFIFGIVLTLGVFLLIGLGKRIMQRAQLLMYAFGMLGLVVAAVILLTTSRGHFISTFNDFARPFTHRGDSYSYFISQGATAGVHTNTGIDWAHTIFGSAAILSFTVWTWWSVCYAGELRQASTRRNWYSMIGGLALTFIPVALIIAIMNSTFGTAFLPSLSAVSGNPHVYSLPVTPLWIVFVALIHPAWGLVVFLGLTFVMWGVLQVYVNAVYPSRTIFAWAFDQIIPARLSAVSSRRATPVAALTLLAVLTIPLCWWAAYTTSFFRFLTLDIVLIFPAFALVGVSAIVLPRRQQRLYDASSARINVLGVPLVELFGVGAIVVATFMAYCYFTQAPLGLPGAGESVGSQLFTSPSNGGLALLAVFIIASLVFYGIAWLVRRSEGIDLTLTGLELPPE